MVTPATQPGSGRSGVIVFLSDYGLSDPYVGICHAVIAGLAPDARIIDLSHGVPPQDVRAGALMLLDSLPFLPPGVVLGVVDPGVGTERRAVAIHAGPGPRWFVGPDNGLLAPAVSAAGGARQAWSIDHVPGVTWEVSATFHGRDLFAPAAALLASGGDAATLGGTLPVDSLTALPFPQPQVGQGHLMAEVLVTDGFGTLVLSARWQDLEAAGLGMGEPVAIRVAKSDQSADVTVSVLPGVLGQVFADAPAGHLIVLPDSAGRVSVAVNGGSAAQRLGARRGDHVQLRSSAAGDAHSALPRRRKP
jgi:S-adenosyl-L-methionine hydrolase (adenosine-forming)